MKLFSISSSIIVGLGALGLCLLLPDKRSGEDKTLRLAQEEVSSRLVMELPTQSGEPISASTSRTQDKQNTGQQDTSADVLRRVPQALKARSVIGFGAPMPRPSAAEYIWNHESMR